MNGETSGLAAPTSYEARLAAWKVAHGYVDPNGPHSVEEAEANDAALRAADRTNEGEDYCVACGNGPLPISSMCLITAREDPYVQREDGGRNTRVRACRKCYANEYEGEGISED